MFIIRVLYKPEIGCFHTISKYYVQESYICISQGEHAKYFSAVNMGDIESDEDIQKSAQYRTEAIDRRLPRQFFNAAQMDIDFETNVMFGW